VTSRVFEEETFSAAASSPMPISAEDGVRKDNLWIFRIRPNSPRSEILMG